MAHQTRQRRTFQRADHRVTAECGSRWELLEPLKNEGKPGGLSAAHAASDLPAVGMIKQSHRPSASIKKKLRIRKEAETLCGPKKRAAPNSETQPRRIMTRSMPP